MDGEIWLKEECCQIQDAVFEVYREMGCGFLEVVYQECMAKELSNCAMKFFVLFVFFVDDLFI